ncbi:MAG TPA: serine/threonine-protein kinase [Polyangiales bacterium]|nr:serine/threonine-protein kinase [Polyangiales bacterium]
MLSERTPQSIEHSEESRAFLQARVALFWKVMCSIMLFASALAVVGAFKHPGMDLFIDLALTAQAGLFAWLCQRGQRSVRFTRAIEGVGLLLYFSGSSLIGRFVLLGFIQERSLVTSEGTLMADAYMSAMGLSGAALMMVVRAALIPSSPRRTIAYTSAVGLPTVLSPTLLAPSAHAGFSMRALDSNAYPWLPAGLVIVWILVVIASTVISRVIFGLRAEIREARKLGQYVLEQKIGEGGMGEVYRAWHGMMRRPTALKLLRPDRAGESAVLRFEREVQLTARLTHPNTITIFDYGRTDDGIFYYAMELLDGATLQRIVEVSGRQLEGRVVRILTMACGALAEAHAIGLIHRDIKPANIMLCTQGGERDVVKLLDFGLVKQLAVAEQPSVSVADSLTGTPLYMAPESILAPDSVDARADIYALGAVAYFLLAGSEVFTGNSVVEVCGKHVHELPQPLAARGVQVSTELEQVVLACLEKKPDRRPESALELRRRLEACKSEPWDSDAAKSWWLEHEPSLAGAAPGSIGEALTIAVALGRSGMRSRADSVD